MIGQLVVLLAWLFVGFIGGVGATLLVVAYLKPHIHPKGWRPESLENPPDWLKYMRITGQD